MRPIEIRLVGRFRFTSKIAGQHEHLLYKGVHTQTGQSLFLKGEEYKSRPNDHFLTILQEGKILQIMQGGTGIAHMHWCSQEQDYNFIVLEELDRSVEALLTLCGGFFTFKTVLMLGQEIIAILQYFHFKNFIHNQIMPRNLMLGPGEKQGKLFLVDFGAASRFKDAKTLEHTSEQKKGEARAVNLQFSSLRYNRGESISRRDDMESMLYLMLYLVKGTLPWIEAARNVKKTEGERVRAVLKIKQEIREEELFEGYPEFLLLFRYTKTLAFDEKPRYAYYKNVMKQKIEQMGMIDDHIYDWMLVDDPLPLQDPEINFDIIPNEAEFIKQLSEQLKLREKAESEREKEKEKEKKAAMPTQVLSPRSKEKECLIY